MKKLIIILLLSLPFYATAQIITTIAGNGSNTNTGDGSAATAAGIDLPGGIVFDRSDNLYLTTATGNRIRKISADDIITTVAGTGSGGYTGDNGPATTAKLNDPQLIVVDTTGNFYFSDEQNNCIRKVDIASGIITTIAGTGAMGYSGDGVPATAAVFYGPNGLCFDKKGNLYIADYFNSRVRKINTAGIITNFAGTGVPGYNGDGGLADTSEIQGVLNICSDDTGNIYIADESNGKIRKVDTFGIIHTIAGTGLAGDSGDGASALAAHVEPHCITWDKSGSLYFSDIYRNTVRRVDNVGIITTVAGNGLSGYLGDNGPATAAEFDTPFGVTTDTCGNLYICDGNNYRIRKVTFDTSCGIGATSLSSNVVSYSEVSIYPNPTNDKLQLNNITNPTNYNLHNIVGTTLQQGKLKEGGNTLSLGALPTGMYLLEMIDEEGNKTVKKIIKQ